MRLPGSRSARECEDSDVPVESAPTEPVPAEPSFWTGPLIWISLAVLAVLAIALVVGLVLARRRRVSLTEDRPKDAPPVTGKDTYKTTGGIGFSSGTEEKEKHPVADRTETDGQPGVGDDASVPRDTPRRGIVDVQLPEQQDTEPEPEPAAPVVDEIEPTAGRMERLRGRLSRSRSTLGQSLLGLLGAGDLDEDSWTDIEDTLLMADLGSTTANEVIERLRKEITARGVRTAEEVRGLLREVLVDALHPEMDRSVRALPHDGRPAVVLVVGVNGTGKTTTTGKLSRVLVADGRTVLLGAADTFRAAAAEQLATWGERAGAEVVRGAEGADPAAVAFDAVKRGIEAKVDAVLVDTAGRLHTKTGLMDELGKVKRVVSKQAEVDEVLLVLDATTGQNGLTQARVFSEVVDVTGVVLTKLDGTAKGGIVFQVQRELGVPVKLVGLGEGADDLAPFEPGAFVDALLR
ncbi:signal recognition particle-docking protein FtsY [Allokutzneria albata]|uniref:Signal recognition particle receptor FtsY n=1 Tax=Allokutzneria albata TaxID=211114 RepID=A0A1G9XFE4_ALLAB|nr:signal recognition particle-docking protein FtsY [Allokutzneria albata]